MIESPQGGIRRLASRLGRMKLLRYLVVGVVNTTFSYSMYAAFIWLGLAVATASLCSMVLGILFSFTTQGKLVFQNATPSTFVKFVLTWMVMYFINLGIIQSLIHWGLDPYQAGALAILPVTVISFLLLNYVVFRRRPAPHAVVRQP